MNSLKTAEKDKPKTNIKFGIILITLVLLGRIICSPAATICSLPSFSNTDPPVEIYAHGEAGQRRVALTFDDGPHEVFTPHILDILEKEEVNATFFVVGKNAETYPELIDRIIDDGHEIGNHTFEHTYLKGLDRTRQTREIELCDDELFYHSEYNSHLLRPPGGLYDDNVLDICAERGYAIVIWSIDTRDWAGTSAEEIAKTVLDNIEDGAIILMHDYNRRGSHTVEAVSYLVPEIKKLGYSFVTVSELIGK